MMSSANSQTGVVAPVMPTQADRQRALEEWQSAQRAVDKARKQPEHAHHHEAMTPHHARLQGGILGASALHTRLVNENVAATTQRLAQTVGGGIVGGVLSGGDPRGAFLGAGIGYATSPSTVQGHAHAHEWHGHAAAIEGSLVELHAAYGTAGPANV